MRASLDIAYDGNGNQTSRTDASGVTRYVYGADDRLAGVALPGGGGSAYEYDANGLRVKKADAGGTTRYLLDGLSIVGQYGTDGARQALYVQSLARIDEVLSVVNGQGKHWYQADALGSIYTLTTAAGEVRARGGYDVFGAPVAESGAAVGQPFGFTGREHELESGLVYARDRYLSSISGRWPQPDRLGMVDGPNRYAYVANGPTMWIDPTGQMIWLPLAVVGVSLFVGISAYMMLSDEPEPRGMENFAIGFFDGLSLGLARIARQALDLDCYTDYSTRAYWYGFGTGVAALVMLVMSAIAGVGVGQQVAVVHWNTWQNIILAGGKIPAGSWVEIGGANYLRYLLTGVLSKGYPYAARIVQEVEKTALAWPSGVEWFKGLFGQRIFRP